MVMSVYSNRITVTVVVTVSGGSGSGNGIDNVHLISSSNGNRKKIRIY